MEKCRRKEPIDAGEDRDGLPDAMIEPELGLKGQRQKTAKEKRHSRDQEGRRKQIQNLQWKDSNPIHSVTLVFLVNGEELIKLRLDCHQFLFASAI